MLRTISFVIEARVTTEVRVTGNLDGTLSFEFSRLGAGSLGDLEAVFLDLHSPLANGGLRVYGDAGMSEGAIVDEGRDMIGRTARIECAVVDALGDFDIGVVFGALAADRGVVTRTGFTLAHETAPLSLDMIDLADFGLRFVPPAAPSGAGSRPPCAPLGARGTAARRDALEVIEIRTARASPLAHDSRGGVLAVIDLRDGRDAVAGAAAFAGNRGPGAQAAPGPWPDPPRPWDAVHPPV